MAYWWERYDKTPINNSDPPPDGAPEDHFPDQVNNIQRQNMSAVAEIGEKVLGPGDGTSAPQAALSISGPFLKLIYDALLPVNTIQAWDSKAGTILFTDQIPDFPEFSSVDWQQCDAGGTGGAPDLSLQLISGANSVSGPDQSFTGDQKAAENMGPAGAVDTSSVRTGGTAISIAQMPIHNHPDTFAVSTTGSNHEHTYQRTSPGSFGHSGSGAHSDGNSSFSTTGGGVHGHTLTGSVSNAGSGDTHDHSMSNLTIPDHIHTAGQPASAALEYYIRVA